MFRWNTTRNHKPCSVTVWPEALPDRPPTRVHCFYWLSVLAGRQSTRTVARPGLRLLRGTRTGRNVIRCVHSFGRPFRCEFFIPTTAIGGRLNFRFFCITVLRRLLAPIG